MMTVRIDVTNVLSVRNEAARIGGLQVSTFTRRGPAGWPVLEVSGDEDGLRQLLETLGYGPGEYEVIEPAA
jgi:hypothetical protein